MNLYNTKTRSIEKFIPNEGKEVKLYTCGPTVYHFAHIGNLRSYIMEDVLEKALNYLGYHVTRCMNITDVGHLSSDSDTGEDKMLKGAKREKKTVLEIAEMYTNAFFEDCKKLNIKKPEIIAPATKHIDEYIKVITKLLEKGYAYESNGNIYFDIADLFENNKNYNELVDSCWNDLLNNKELYDEQFNSFASSQNAYNMALKWYEKLYYNSALGKFMGPNGGLYYSIDEIPKDELQKEIDKIMPEIFKMNKISEWNLNDSSSSSQYLATFKLGIRNSGDFTEFNNLSQNIIEKAEIQFDTMNKVAVDNVGNYMNEKFYSKEWYDALEASSFIKHDNILGMTVNQIGNMAIPVLSSMIPGVGSTLSSGLLFASAFGGANEEAINSGAGYNKALGYAMLSASTEILIEKAFSGIAGFGEGWMDNLLNYIPNKIIIQ